jgi:two-component system chemotaxis sensor kinase CheA
MPDSSDQWDEKEVAELRKIFYVQAYEIVESLQDEIFALESKPGDEDLLKTVKRHIHTLKGDSKSIGLVQIGTLCHRMEDVLMAGGGHEGFDVLMSAVDSVHQMLSQSESRKESVPAADILFRIDRFLAVEQDKGAAPEKGLTEYEELQIQDAQDKGLHVYDIEVEFHPLCSERSVAALMLGRRLREKGAVIKFTPAPEKVDSQAGSMRVIFSTDCDVAAVKALAAITGMTSPADVTEQRSSATRPPEQGAAGQHRNAGSDVLRIDAAKVDLVMDLVGELIIGRSMMEQLARDINSGMTPGDTASRLLAANAYMDRAVSDLQKSVMKMRMVPVYAVFKKFPKMVRDLCADKDRKARLELSGADTELDKGIVDALGEPLAHLVRNMIDHGIETPEERRIASKKEEGRIILKAYHEASQIVIEASDDGRGIDREKLKRKAVETGRMTGEESDKLSEEGSLNLMFLSGLSTASVVSETSGRGIGMDAVKTAVESLKGTIEVETEPGRGSLFRLRLPLTLAVINVLLFEVGDRMYAVPLPVIAEVARVAVDQLVTVNGRKTLLLRDRTISIISMGEMLGVEGDNKRKKNVLILEAGGRKAGLLIDRLLWQQELVIKAIDDRHLQTECIAGASILGSGKVVLILDVHAVIRKAVAEEKKKGLVPL